MHTQFKSMRLNFVNIIKRRVNIFELGAFGLCECDQLAFINSIFIPNSYTR